MYIEIIGIGYLETRSKFIHVPKNAGTSIESLCDSWGHYPARLVPEEERKHLWAVYRDPYDRAVSIYHYLKRKNRGLRNLTFKEFWSSNPRHPAHNKIQTHVCNIESSHTEMLCDEGQIIVPTIVPFEDLPKFFKQTFKKELPLLNKTDRQAWERYYDAESYQIITERYRDDLEKFNG